MRRDVTAQIIVVLLWVFSVVIWAVYDFWYLTVLLFALHVSEMFIKGIKVGKRAGKSPLLSATMTLIFGFTWWLPLERELARSATTANHGKHELR